MQIKRFMAIATILPPIILALVATLSDIAGAIQAITDTQKWMDDRKLPEGASYVFSCFAIATAVFAGRYAYRVYLRHRRNIDAIDSTEAPQNIRRISINKLSPRIRFSDLKAYSFRYAAAESEIRDLAQTEDYDQTPDEYNSETLVARWHNYRKGNWLCVRDGKVRGGIDVWPLSPEGYNKLLSGAFGEDQHFENSIFEAAHETERNTHWYLGSISIDVQLRHEAIRRDVIIMLLASFINEFLEADTTEYPCQIVALAWSNRGRNMLSKFGFSLVPSEHKFGHVYEIRFKSKDRLEAFAAPYLAALRHIQSGMVDA